ncbi:transposase [Pelosinus fermentans]|uniref:Transposase IS200-family protein n=1 Tax=Pelosinus fermentans JBW45 TaxID=1192197 RepID=I9NVD9_9FIRM|nr:transposase [Pelosinus fermentans]AJQ28769.1 transposase IS200-family protein [Pelosinus fermentans JBW45]
MARKPRVHYEDAIYHVMARGNNRDRVFESEEDKAKYLKILADYKERYDFKLYAYVVMDNHVHLLLQVGKDPLAKIMQGIQQRYTQYYNWHHKHSGHVFEQRYKAFICEEESYIMALICYIHQNPVKANILEGINYSWSSHQAYVSRLQGLVNVEFILNILSIKPNEAMTKYLALVGTAVDRPKYKDEKEQEKETQKAWLQAETEKGQTELMWEQLVAKITVEEEVNQEKLIGKCRIRQVVAARKRLIYEAINRSIMTKMQLAKLLQIDPANITRIWQAKVGSKEIK